MGCVCVWQAQSKREVIETKNKFDEQHKHQTRPFVTATAHATGLEALGTAHTLPIILMPLLGVSSRELLPAPLALVYRWILRMRALVMAVTVVLAGERSAALVTLVAKGRGGRGLNGRPRDGRKRRWVWALKDPWDGKRGCGDEPDLMRRTVGILLALLLVLILRRVGLGRRWL